MIGREVERREVVPLRLRLGAERNGEAELAEDVLYLFDDQRDRMLRAKPLSACRHREIDFALRRAGGVELPTTVLEGALELRLDGVDQRARFAQLGRRQRWQLLEQLRQPPRFPAEERSAGLFQQSGGCGRVDQLLAVSGERSNKLLKFRKRHGS